MSDESKIRSLLSIVKETHANMIVEKAKSFNHGNQFNVFNVIGLWSEEVRLHSAMIRELLDPAGSHGCHDNFLKCFLRHVLNIDLLNNVSLSKAEVESEFYISPISPEGEEGGRIDILVRMPDGLPAEHKIPNIIIENKIYATDQENQLLRYYNFGRGEFANNFRLVYLTLDGKQPSESSVGNVNDLNPICISYSYHIKKWLQSCAQIAFDKPKVRETIIQYIDLLQQITEYSMKETDNIVKVVAESDESIISGLQICSRRNNIIYAALQGPIKKLFENIAKEAKDKLDLEVQYKPAENFEFRGSKIDWSFKFLISTSDGKRQVCLKYIFNTWDLADLYYGIDNNETVGVLIKPIFAETTDYWRYGWEWMPEPFKTWNCEKISEILKQIKTNGFNSDFAKTISDTIEKAAELCKMSRS